MSWARLDDRFHGNRKIRRAWKQSRAAVGLHVLAITFCAQQETDGHVDDDWLEGVLPAVREREQVVGVLVEHGLWHRNGDGFVLNDYLAYNPSKAQLDAKRQRERARRERAA